MEGWSLAGRKIYSTGSPALAWGLVWARTDEAEPRTGQFLVPMRAPGVRIVETWDQAGLRASGSHDVLFRDVILPAEHALDLRAPAEWGRPDPEQVAWNTLLVAALYTGVARAARDWLVGFLRDRRPPTSARRSPLCRGSRRRSAASRRCCSPTSGWWPARDGDAAPVECGLIKTVTAENATAAVQDAVALCGNHALSRANPLERHLRDVLCARPHSAAGQRAPRHRPRGAATDSRTGGDRTVTAPHPVEFIGMIQPRQQSEIHPARGPAIDPGYLVASARVHDEGGFDRILVGRFSNGPDGFQIAASQPGGSRLRTSAARTSASAPPSRWKRTTTCSAASTPTTSSGNGPRCPGRSRRAPSSTPSTGSWGGTDASAGYRSAGTPSRPPGRGRVAPAHAGRLPRRDRP